jgi:hypothetical protein
LLQFYWARRPETFLLALDKEQPAGEPSALRPAAGHAALMAVDSFESFRAVTRQATRVVEVRLPQVAKCL